MIAIRCILAGYLIAALTATSLFGIVASLAAVLIFWLGGACLTMLLALAWHLLVPEAEPQDETVADRGCEAERNPPHKYAHAA